jgi:hypothetical protein
LDRAGHGNRIKTAILPDIGSGLGQLHVEALP